MQSLQGDQPHDTAVLLGLQRAAVDAGVKSGVVDDLSHVLFGRVEGMDHASRAGVPVLRTFPALEQPFCPLQLAQQLHTQISQSDNRSIVLKYFLMPIPSFSNACTRAAPYVPRRTCYAVRAAPCRKCRAVRATLYVVKFV